MTVPPLTVSVQKKTAMTKDLAVDYQPVPLIRHQVKEKNPIYPAKTTGGTQSQASRKIFPHIQMGPALLKEQFKIPKDVAESKQSKKRPAAQEKGQEIPSKAPRRATRSAAQSGSSAGPSVPVSIPLSSIQQTPTTAVAPSGSPKKICLHQLWLYH